MGIVVLVISRCVSCSVSSAGDDHDHDDHGHHGHDHRDRHHHDHQSCSVYSPLDHTCACGRGHLSTVILLRLFAHFHPGASFICVSFGGKCNFARLSSSGGGCQLFEIGDCHSSSTHSVFYYLFPRDDKLGRNLKKKKKQMHKKEQSGLARQLGGHLIKLAHANTHTCLLVARRLLRPCSSPPPGYDHQHHS